MSIFTKYGYDVSVSGAYRQVERAVICTILQFSENPNQCVTRDITAIDGVSQEELAFLRACNIKCQSDSEFEAVGGSGLNATAFVSFTKAMLDSVSFTKDVFESSSLEAELRLYAQENIPIGVIPKYFIFDFPIDTREQMQKYSEIVRKVNANLGWDLHNLLYYDFSHLDMKVIPSNALVLSYDIFAEAGGILYEAYNIARRQLDPNLSLLREGDKLDFPLSFSVEFTVALQKLLDKYYSEVFIPFSEEHENAFLITETHDYSHSDDNHERLVIRCYALSIAYLSQTYNIVVQSEGRVYFDVAEYQRLFANGSIFYTAYDKLLYLQKFPMVGFIEYCKPEFFFFHSNPEDRHLSYKLNYLGDKGEVLEILVDALSKDMKVSALFGENAFKVKVDLSRQSELYIMISSAVDSGLGDESVGDLDFNIRRELVYLLGLSSVNLTLSYKAVLDRMDYIISLLGNDTLSEVESAAVYRDTDLTSPSSLIDCEYDILALEYAFFKAGTDIFLNIKNTFYMEIDGKMRLVYVKGIDIQFKSTLFFTNEGNTPIQKVLTAHQLDHLIPVDTFQFKNNDRSSIDRIIKQMEEVLKFDFSDMLKRNSIYRPAYAKDNFGIMYYIVCGMCLSYSKGALLNPKDTSLKYQLYSAINYLLCETETGIFGNQLSIAQLRYNYGDYNKQLRCLSIFGLTQPIATNVDLFRTVR